MFSKKRRAENIETTPCTTPTTTTYYEVSECPRWVHPADTGVVLEARTPTNRNDPKGMIAREERSPQPRSHQELQPQTRQRPSTADGHPRRAGLGLVRRTQQNQRAELVPEGQQHCGLPRPITALMRSSGMATPTASRPAASGLPGGGGGPPAGAKLRRCPRLGLSQHGAKTTRERAKPLAHVTDTFVPAEGANHAVTPGLAKGRSIGIASQAKLPRGHESAGPVTCVSKRVEQFYTWLAPSACCPADTDGSPQAPRLYAHDVSDGHGHRHHGDRALRPR